MSLEASSSSSTVVVVKADIFLSSTDASLSERDKAFLYVAAPRRLFSRVCSSLSLFSEAHLAISALPPERRKEVTPHDAYICENGTV